MATPVRFATSILFEVMFTRYAILVMDIPSMSFSADMMDWSISDDTLMVISVPLIISCGILSKVRNTIGEISVVSFSAAAAPVNENTAKRMSSRIKICFV